MGTGQMSSGGSDTSTPVARIVTGAVTVLAVGNPIMADDGVGPALLDLLRAARPDADVTWLDGGTGGMELLPAVQEATRLLVLDAVAGDRPGAVVTLTGDHLPRLLAGRLSPHQVGLLDVFAAARLLRREPEQVEVVGVVPESVELRVGLSAPVERALPAACAAAAGVLDRWLQVPAVAQP